MGETPKASFFGRLGEKRRQRKAARAERAHARGERERQRISDKKGPYNAGSSGGG